MSDCAGRTLRRESAPRMTANRAHDAFKLTQREQGLAWTAVAGVTGNQAELLECACAAYGARD